MSSETTAIIKQQVLSLKTTAEALRNELAASDEISRGLLMAMAITQLRDMLLKEQYLDALLPLHNTQLGYLTDEQPHKGNRYTNEQIAAFVVHCLLDGDPLSGGHVMIFGGKKYRTKTGWLRMLKLAKVAELNVQAAAPEEVSESRNQSGSLRMSGKCTAFAECKVNGQRFRVDLARTAAGDYRVDVDGNGKDRSACFVQMRGKAEARAAARLHQMITGTDSGEDEPVSVTNVLPEMPDNWQFSKTAEDMFARNIAHAERQQSAGETAAGQPLQTTPQESPPSSGFDPDGYLHDEAAALQDRFGGAEGELATAWFTELASAKSVRQLQTSWQAWGRVAKENGIDTEHDIYKFLTRVKDLLKEVHGG